MCPILFAGFIDTLLCVYAVAHATRTVAKMRRTLQLIAGLGVTTTAELTTEVAARFVADRSRAVGPNTVRGDLSYLSAACSFAIEEGWLDRPPQFRRIRPRPLRPEMPRCHSIDEIGRVLDLLRSRSGTWTGARLYALTATVAYTALRRDEALTLMVRDVDLAASILIVTDRQRRKTVASSAPVPIPADLDAILTDWIPMCGCKWLFPGVRQKGPWTGGASGMRACDQIRDVGQECGVEGLTMQSLRHTFATHAHRDWGLAPIQLMNVLRHTSPRTQELYIHAAKHEELVQSVNRVSYQRRKPVDATT